MPGDGGKVFIIYLPPPAHAQAQPAQAQAQAHELPPPPLILPPLELVETGIGFVREVTELVKVVGSPITLLAIFAPPSIIEAAKAAPGKLGNEKLGLGLVFVIPGLGLGPTILGPGAEGTFPPVLILGVE